MYGRDCRPGLDPWHNTCICRHAIATYPTSTRHTTSIPRTVHTPPDALRSPSSQVELPKIVAALKRAAADERCRGVVTYVGPREHLGGLATVQVGRKGGRAAWECGGGGGGRGALVTWAVAFTVCCGP